MKKIGNIVLYESGDKIDVMEPCGEIIKKTVPAGYDIQVTTYNETLNGKCAKIVAYNKTGTIDGFSVDCRRDSDSELEKQIKRIFDFALFVLNNK